MIKKDIHSPKYPELHEPSIRMGHLLKYADWSTFFSLRGFDEVYPHILLVDHEAAAIHDEVLDEVSRLMKCAPDHRPRIEAMTRNFRSEDHGTFILSWFRLKDFGSIQTELREAIAYLFSTGAIGWLSQQYGHDGVYPNVLPIDPSDDGDTGKFWQQIFDDYCPPGLIEDLSGADVILTVVATLEHTEDELHSITIRENLYERYGRLREIALQTYIQYRVLTIFVVEEMHRDIQRYFGQSLVDIYRLSLEYSELKLRVQLIQKALNRDEAPDYEWIDAEVTRQLSHMREDVRSKERELSATQRMVTDHSDDEEIISLYSRLVSYLHPDLRSSCYEYDEEVFDAVEKAFDQKDLPRLHRAMSQIPILDGTPHGDPRSDEVVVDSICIFEQIIHKYDELIKDRKHNYPFSYSEILSSEEKIQENCDSLQSQINDLVDKVHEYQSRYDQLMRQAHD